MMENFIKVRLTDEEGLNSETAWAYAKRESGHNYTPCNLYLILDNNTEYFGAGTELILQEDGYNVDMEATRELAKARAIIDKYHGWTAEDTMTAKVAKMCLKRQAYSQFVGETIEVKSGKYLLESIYQDSDLSVGLNGVHIEDGSVKRFNDINFLNKKIAESGEAE